MSFGRRGSLLGQAVTCTGEWAIGGAFKVMPDFSYVEVRPDDEPGAVYRFYNPYTHPDAGDTIRFFAGAQGMQGRAALAGDVLSDGRVLFFGGSGKLSANEFYKKAFRGPCQGWTTGAPPNGLGIPYVPVGGGAVPTGGGAPTPPPETPPPAKAPWTGEQVATVQVTGAGVPENVKLYGVDGKVYKLAAGSDPDTAKWLATYAPQGPELVVKGTWDEAAELVKVTDAYIKATGSRGYGTTPEGEIGPPSEDYPSTNPEGTGLMPQKPREPAGAGTTPTTAGAGAGPGAGTWLALGALLALVASQGRRR